MRGLSYQLDNRRDRAAEPLTCLLFIGLTLFVSPAFAQIYHVQDMNTEQIKALDREKTVVILPDGILEEHGPYLPSFSDGFDYRQMKRLGDEIAPLFEPSVDGKTVTQENPKIERKQQGWLKQKGVFGAGGGSSHGYLSLWRRTQREFAAIATQLFFSREMARFDISRIMARY